MQNLEYITNLTFYAIKLVLLLYIFFHDRRQEKLRQPKSFILELALEMEMMFNQNFKCFG